MRGVSRIITPRCRMRAGRRISNASPARRQGSTAPKHLLRPESRPTDCMFIYEAISSPTSRNKAATRAEDPQLAVSQKAARSVVQGRISRPRALQ
eukprot:2444620-Pyramimonas_sp.AAC.1